MDIDDIRKQREATGLGLNELNHQRTLKEKELGLAKELEQLMKSDNIEVLKGALQAAISTIRLAANNRP